MKLLWSAAALCSLALSWTSGARAADAQVVPLEPRVVTCVTYSRLLLTTNEGCRDATEAERVRLNAEGLRDAEPVMIVLASGEVLRGRSTTPIEGRWGHVDVSDKRVSCTGDFDPSGPNPFAITFACTDGRTGVAWGSTNVLGQSAGDIQMSDGERARFAGGCYSHVGDIPTCQRESTTAPFLIIRQSLPAAAR